MKKIALSFLILIPASLFATVTRSEADHLFSLFNKVYTEHITFNPPVYGTSLSNFDFDLVHASYVAYGNNHHVINIFGGVIDLPQMSIDGLATVICHEIGHGLGGAPYDHEGSSVEGQCDYYATSICLQKIFETYESTYRPLTDQEASICHGDQMCLRVMAAIRDGSMQIFNHNLKVNLSILDVDDSVVQEINKDERYYPSPECRMMTMRNGVLGLPRPSCWYVD